MEGNLVTYNSLCYPFVLAFKLLFTNRRWNLPPSPVPALPVIGHFYLLKKPLHRTLGKRAEKHGSIFSLRFGTRLVVVLSSSSVAEECFTKKDVVLANLPFLLSGKYIGYDYTNMVTAPYGDHWRNLCRLSAQEIFSATRLNMFLSVRQDEIKRLLRSLYRNSQDGFAMVNLRSRISELSFNVIMRMVTGKRYFGEDKCDEEQYIFESSQGRCFCVVGRRILEISCPFFGGLITKD